MNPSYVATAAWLDFRDMVNTVVNERKMHTVVDLRLHAVVDLCLRTVVDMVCHPLKVFDDDNLLGDFGSVGKTWSSLDEQPLVGCDSPSTTTIPPSDHHQSVTASREASISPTDVYGVTPGSPVAPLTLQFFCAPLLGAPLPFLLRIILQAPLTLFQSVIWASLRLGTRIKRALHRCSTSNAATRVSTRRGRVCARAGTFVVLRVFARGVNLDAAALATLVGWVANPTVLNDIRLDETRLQLLAETHCVSIVDMCRSSVSSLVQDAVVLGFSDDVQAMQDVIRALRST